MLESNLNYKEIFEYLVNRTQKYLEDNHLWAMILGVSGGIDSTVTAAICHEVEKRNPDIKFIGVSLPCTSNSSKENDSAQLCLKAFCKENHYYTENLQKEYMLMKATCAQRHIMTTIGAGNIKARLRMIVLYNEANYFSGLVMDTDNLTEHYLGFFTVHGDVADFNPIGCLWKHEVYGLAKYLYEEYYNQPFGAEGDRHLALEHALNITPTDGNGVKAGGDMAQIAPTFMEDTNVEAYTKVDHIIQSYLNSIEKLKDKELYKGEIIDGLYKLYGKETVDGIIHRINRTEYKRERLPIAIQRDEILKYLC